MMMKRFNILLLMAAMVIGFAACGDDDDNNGKTATEQLEELSMNTEWINYATATASELLDDCIQLWAAWNGPDGVTGNDLDRIGGSSFFSRPGIGSNGYAVILKSAGEAGNTAFESQEFAIETILIDGFANISNEVGAAKIGEPNGFAKDGDNESAVYAVESWYSWNSITDYSDNIISIKNGYCGRRGAIGAAANANSLSTLVKSINPALDANVNAAINGAYNAIQSMTAPFRSNLTGDKVDAAMDACADLTDIIENELLPVLVTEETDYDFTEILRVYADEVVVPTYKDLKDKAWTLYNAVDALRQDPTSQTKLNAACEAWRAARVPWEQSEAILFGPASEDMLGLDPSMDSWPLSQESIAGILQNNLKTVNDFIGAIGSEDVRGFHTLELLLFKDGKNRTIRN
ncbi:MAG: peptidase M75 [Prevotellaceae bacterium]|jgi:predicted lipoprotein|nr:peptidase M75 [Prevotellaceae bacterium]